MPHIIRAQQFDRRSLETIFRRTKRLGTLLETPEGKTSLQRLYSGKQLLNVFETESLRTRASFDWAGRNLGMQVFNTQSGSQFSSEYFNRGETLEDTIRVLCSYMPPPDVIVLRSREEGDAERAAKVSPVPIINAGDGKGQHPTQSVLDLYTIQDEFEAIDGLTVLIGGDLAYGRTARSLAYLLSKFKGVMLIFVSPPQLRMGKDVLDHLLEHDVPFFESATLKDVIGHADVVYWTRTQREKMGDDALYEEILRVADQYRIDPRIMALMKQTAILLHPLPRNSEIDPAIDADPRVRYFHQTKNSVPVRMALLELSQGCLGELSSPM